MGLGGSEIGRAKGDRLPHGLPGSSPGGFVETGAI